MDLPSVIGEERAGSKDGGLTMTQHVVIIGGGFAGLHAAQALRHQPVRVTLIDKRNFHLFQPLLYQVATGELSPGDIASPLRQVLRKSTNTQVIAGEVIDIDPDAQRVILHDSEIAYDALIVATGATHSYFGRDDEWAARAPGLKTIEDAIEIRRRILLAYETAEREPDPDLRRAWTSFVIVGAGPTGVELAGAVSELAHQTLRNEFRTFDPRETQINLVEGLDRVLTAFPEELSADAQAVLAKRDVTVRLGWLVTEIEADQVVIRNTGTDETQTIPTHTVLWAAGVAASPLGRLVAERTGAETDRAGRVVVQPDLTLAGYPNLFVVGDLAHFAHTTDGRPLPGVAQVAMQQGSYAAKLLERRREAKPMDPFDYRDVGNLAVIGRNAAVADIGWFRSVGFIAWTIWAFIHIASLVEFGNRIMVMAQWAWTYLTSRRGDRLITGDPPYPVLERRSEEEQPIA
jgi:NADH dehydrogenase